MRVPEDDSMKIDQVRAILSEILKIDLAQLPDNAALYRTQNWDSLAHLEIVLAVEELTGEHISDDEVEQITTLQALERFILSNRF